MHLYSYYIDWLPRIGWPSIQLEENIYEQSHQQRAANFLDIIIPQHQQIYQNSLVGHMQSIGVYYIRNSYNRNFGSPAKKKCTKAIKFSRNYTMKNKMEEDNQKKC